MSRSHRCPLSALFWRGTEFQVTLNPKSTRYVISKPTIYKAVQLTLWMALQPTPDSPHVKEETLELEGDPGETLHREREERDAHYDYLVANLAIATEEAEALRQLLLECIVDMS